MPRGPEVRLACRSDSILAIGLFWLFQSDQCPLLGLVFADMDQTGVLADFAIHDCRVDGRNALDRAQMEEAGYSYVRIP